MTKDNSEYLIERRENVYEVVIGLHASDQHLRLGTGFSNYATLHPRRHQGST